MDPEADIHFDGWTLHRRSGELARNGTRIRLQPQPLQVLEELLANAGEVVTREQLIARLWPKGVVDFDTALNSAVRRLRQALGDEADTPRYIETLARRGYRFIGTLAPVAAPSATAGEPPAQVATPSAVPDAPADAHFVTPLATMPGAAAPRATRRWWPAAATLLVAALTVGFWTQDRVRSQRVEPAPPATASVPPSIAVLPFVDMSPRDDQQYFADGLAEEVINLLAQSPELRVTARTSSFTFRDQKVDVPTIAGRLGVTHVLEGSVRRDGDRVRVTAQLIDAGTNLHLWSQTYDRRIGDVFGVQSDIAASVASALRLVLRVHAGPTADPQAYDDYLLGRYLAGRRGPGDVERARQYYERALAADPGFALAWAGLSSAAWLDTVEGRSPRKQGLEQVRLAAEHALSLDPRLAEAHLRLAQYLHVTGDGPAADEHLQDAMALEPNNALALSMAAAKAADERRTADAIGLLQRAVAADPLAWVYRYNLAETLFTAGRMAEAKAQALEVRTLQPGNPGTSWLLCAMAVVEHGFDDATRILDEWPPGSPDRVECRALAGFGLGHQPDAEAALAELSASTTSSDALRVAEVHAWRGETDLAFRWLRTAAQRARQESGFGVYTRPLPVGDPPPLLRSLGHDPRWSEWIATAQAQP